MKVIKVDDVISISIIEVAGRSKTLFKLSNGWEYYANGDVERIENSYYCHYEFTLWSNC